MLNFNRHLEKETNDYEETTVISLSDNDANEDNYRISDNVFEDLNLKSLFQLFLKDEVAQIILEILKCPPSEFDIKNRQDMFRELEKQSVTDLFLELKSNLYEISKYNNLYEDTLDIRYKAVYFICLLKAYLQFMKNASRLDILKESNSLLLNKFIQSLNKVINGSKFSAMEVELIKIENQLNNIESINIDIYNKDTYHYNISINKEPTLVDRLNEIGQEFGFNAAKRKRQNALELSSTFVDSLSLLYPDIYETLNEFYKKYHSFYNSNVLGYEREITFYLSLKQLFNEVEKLKIPMCYPNLSKRKRIEIYSAYDITLFAKEKTVIIPNDIDFNEEEGFFILTGANGGGKTTFVRTLGVSLILFLAGGRIPAVKAEIYPFNRIFTHFSAEEAFDSVSRLVDEENRAKEILKEANSDSVVLLNETFSSTSIKVSIEKSLKLTERLCSIGAYGVFVTHQYKVAEEAPKIDAATKVGNLSAVVMSDDNNTRTFRIVKKMPDHKSYAFDVLYKHGLTKGELTKRLRGLNS